MKYLISAGLNQISPNYYGTNGLLQGCVNDINDVASWFKPDLQYKMLNQEATVSAFSGAMIDCAKLAKEGDVVLINYSGHGTQVSTTYKGEKDKMDEGFCFYDRIMLDKTFSNLVSNFKEGVKVIAFIDACHSGGLSRDLKKKEYKDLNVKAINTPYNMRGVILNPLKCSYIGLLASAENQYAMDGAKNGLFTQTMLMNFKGQDVISWLKDSAKKVTVQTFNYKTYGKKFVWSNFKF